MGPRPTCQRYSAEQRSQAKAMFLAGEPPSLIGKQVGVPRASIHQWATREGWREMRQELRERSNQAILKTSSRVTENLVEKYLSKVNGITERQLDTLDQLKVKKSASIGEIAKALYTLDKIQRRNLGLDTAEGKAPRQTLHLHVGAQMPAPIVDITPREET